MSKYKGYNDEKLLFLIKEQSNHLAYEVIFERYNSLLYSHIYNKVRNQQEAEDLTQEVFSKFWHKRSNIDLSYKFPGYLFLLARNQVIDQIRRKRAASQSETYFINTASSQQQPADFLLRNNLFSKLIEREIAMLPPRMREAFELRSKKFLSIKEISAKMGISEATAATQIKKAVKVLRLKLKMAAWTAVIILFLY